MIPSIFKHPVFNFLKIISVKVFIHNSKTQIIDILKQNLLQKQNSQRKVNETTILMNNKLVKPTEQPSTNLFT